MSHRWNTLVSLSPCIHPCTLGGRVKAQEEEHRAQTAVCQLSLLNLPVVKDNQGLFTCSLIILPTSELSSALSEPMHEPSLPIQTLSYPDFLTRGKHGCQSCRASPWGLEEGGKRQREFGPRPPGDVLSLRGGLRVGGRAALHNVALLIQTLNKHDYCHGRCKFCVIKAVPDMVRESQVLYVTGDKIHGED